MRAKVKLLFLPFLLLALCGRNEGDKEKNVSPVNGNAQEEKTPFVKKRIFFRDADGDGYGSSATVYAQTPPEGYVAISGDCDDGDPTVFPGAPELCDGKDNDCDSGLPSGGVDEDFQLLGQPCDGPDEDLCAEGKYVCSEDGLSVVCSDTTDSSVEVCDGADNDCDGKVDDDFACGGFGDWISPVTASPPPFTRISAFQTYSFAITLEYSFSSTSSALLCAELEAVEGDTKYVLSQVCSKVKGSGTVTLNIGRITIYSSPDQIHWNVFAYDSSTFEHNIKIINYERVTLYLGEGVLQSVKVSPSGVQVDENQEVEVSVETLYNSPVTVPIDIGAVAFFGPHKTYLVQKRFEVFGSGLRSEVLKFVVPRCADSVGVYVFAEGGEGGIFTIFPVYLTSPCPRKPVAQDYNLSFCEFSNETKTVVFSIRSVPYGMKFFVEDTGEFELSATSGKTPALISVKLANPSLGAGTYIYGLTVDFKSRFELSESTTFVAFVKPATPPRILNLYPSSKTVGILWSSTLPSTDDPRDGFFVLATSNTAEGFSRIAFLPPTERKFVHEPSCPLVWWYSVSVISECGEFFSESVSAVREPPPEVCDGYDNSCEGLADEGCGAFRDTTSKGFSAPLCEGFSSPCTSGFLLMRKGRFKDVVGWTPEGNPIFSYIEEPNHPNTLDGCRDSEGKYDFVNAIYLQGSFLAGTTVTVTVQGHCSTSGNFLHVWYSSGVTTRSKPSWKHVGTFRIDLQDCDLNPEGAYFTVSADLVLDGVSGYHAVRAVYSSFEQPSPCPANDPVADIDDLVFRVR